MILLRLGQHWKYICLQHTKTHSASEAYNAMWLHGFQSSLMWLHLHFATKQQVTRFTCLPPDTQFGQTWHLSTLLRSGESASVVHYTTVTDPTIWQLGFNLPRQSWSLLNHLNHFQTGQGPCRAILHKWSFAKSPTCDCGQQQTISHIVDACPLMKFDGGLLKMMQSSDWNL